MSDDFRRIRSRGSAPNRPWGDVGRPAFLGQAAANSQIDGAFTPMQRVTVTGDDREGASPVYVVESDTSLAVPIEGQISYGQRAPVDWGTYRWSMPVGRSTTPPPAPEDKCPEPGDANAYWFWVQYYGNPWPTDLGPFEMTWDAGLDAWLGQCDVDGYGPSRNFYLYDSGSYCGNFDFDNPPQPDPGGRTTIALAMRRNTKAATLSTQISGGQVVGVDIVEPGYGYQSQYTGTEGPYTILFTGGGGTGAMATAEVNYEPRGRIVHTTVQLGGSGYTSPPTAKVYVPDNWVNCHVVTGASWMCKGQIGNVPVTHSGTPDWIYSERGYPDSIHAETEFMGPPDWTDTHPGWCLGYAVNYADCHGFNAGGKNEMHGGAPGGYSFRIRYQWNVHLAGVSAAFTATATPP